jgi:hypothetical protein
MEYVILESEEFENNSLEHDAIQFPAIINQLK